MESHRQGVTDRLVAYTDLVISISRFTKRRFLSWSTVRDNQVHLLPNAIHMEEYGIGKNLFILRSVTVLGARKY